MHAVRAVLFAGLMGALALTNAAPAEARTEKQCKYSLRQAYSTALRYLRVDLGYEITEKDADAAYLLFTYPAEDGKGHGNGAFELVAGEDAVKIFITLPQMPSYREKMLGDGLERKLRAEYGEPPAPEPKRPPKTDKPRKDDKDKDGRDDDQGSGDRDDQSDEDDNDDEDSENDHVVEDPDE